MLPLSLISYVKDMSLDPRGRIPIPIRSILKNYG